MTPEEWKLQYILARMKELNRTLENDVGLLEKSFQDLANGEFSKELENPQAAMSSISEQYCIALEEADSKILLAGKITDIDSDSKISEDKWEPEDDNSGITGKLENNFLGSNVPSNSDENQKDNLSFGSVSSNIVPRSYSTTEHRSRSKSEKRRGIDLASETPTEKRKAVSNNIISKRVPTKGANTFHPQPPATSNQSVTSHIGVGQTFANPQQIQRGRREV